MERAPRMKITEGSPSTPRLIDSPANKNSSFGLLVLIPAHMKNENKGKEGKEGRKLMGIKGSAIGKGKCSKSKKERKQESSRDCHIREVQKKMKHEHTEKGRKNPVVQIVLK